MCCAYFFVLWVKYIFVISTLYNLMGFIFIFFIIAIVRRVNNIIDREGQVIDSSAMGKDKLTNYFPFVFHVVMALIILLTLLSVKILTEERIGILIADISFQFYTTLLMVVIGLINPFTALSDDARLKLLSLDQKDNTFSQWLVKGKNFQLTKILICVIVVSYFILAKHLRFPALDNSLLSGVAVFLIFFYLLSNLIRLFRNPNQSKRDNMIRLSILFSSIKTSFFLSIGTVVLVFIPSAIMGLDFMDHINPLVIALLGYNIIMAYNEYKVLKLLRSSAND